MTEGYEGGFYIRRDDGTMDVSFDLLARNGEVHLTIEVNSRYGLSKTIVDLEPSEAHELSGALKDAGNQAGEPYRWATKVVPASVAEARDRWSSHDAGHVLGERD